ncbi:MAG: hypothetical protein R2834_09590 [Rhodothermales bacterium]
MRVVLPSYLSARTIYSVVGQVLSDRLEIRSDRFSFDFSALVAVEPAGIAALAGLIDRLRLEGALCALLAGTSSPQEPATQTLHRAGFFPQVLHHPIPFSPSSPTCWMPLLPIPLNRWRERIEQAVLPWLAGELEQSRFVAVWKLSALSDIVPAWDDAAPAIASARIDSDRGRVALSFAGALCPAVFAPEAASGTFERLLAGLPHEVEGWAALHTGWTSFTAIPQGHRRAAHAYPAPVPYPGWLLDLVFSVDSLSLHPLLNEPRAMPAGRPALASTSSSPA